MQNKKFNKKFNKFKKNCFKKKDKIPKLQLLDDEIAKLQEKYKEVNPRNIKFFEELPLSKKTLKGLKYANYKVPTDIQKESIGIALQGRDILGAAITGSGKTLAFLIPILEKLFINKWNRTDGVGAIIISPTRELAYQIFETLKKVGQFHDFSAGLIIGGKNLKFERSRMDQCNIVICTPGRLLQHMDENPLFNCSSMHILVLDEADRCLDMGFEETMNGIIENLPEERQTLLFSATQTKSVKDLARLSLKDPSYIAPNEQQPVTPETLKQNYVVCELEDKIAMLWSFVRNHHKQKLIVFLSTCKQVKYVFEIFCKLRPGISLLALYGTLHQDRRVAIYDDFCRKKSCCLFATDIASRGLDFPIVNWVVQLDCPEDVDQYIHRAGRTARHQAKGESLLILLPSEEEAMIQNLKDRKIQVNQIFVDPKKIFNPKAKMEAYLAANKDLKESAQRALVAYIKSVVLMKNKNIFQVDKLNIDAYALSLGLPFTPRVRFLENLRIKKANKLRAKKNISNNKTEEENEEQNNTDSSDETSNSSDSENEEENLPKSKENNKIVFDKLAHNDSEDEDDDLIKIKRKNHEIEDESDNNDEPIEDIEKLKRERNKAKVVTKASLAKKVIKKKIVPNTKVVYNEEGEQVLDPIKNFQSELGRKYLEDDDDKDGGINIEKAKAILKEEDKFDKERFRQLVKTKKIEKKIKIAKKAEDDGGSDDFESGSEDENDVDLSWLPDPDKIYGKKKKNSDDEEEDDSSSFESDENNQNSYSSQSDSEEEEQESEEEIYHKPPKLLIEKTKKRKNLIENNEGNEESDEENPKRKKVKKMISKLSVEDAEKLALQLLKS